jgi:RHS repeat-associated protein
VYDTSGRMVRHPLGPLVRDITYDDADRVSRFTHYTAATAASAPAYDQSFGYDELSRLISVTGGTNWSYAYDANGNRTASAAGSTARGYTVATSSNRLSALTSPARSMGYDTVGNTLSDSETGSSANYTARYTLEGRLAAMTQGTTAGIELFYDAKGRRVVRSAWTGSSSNPRTVTLYAYDLDSHLIGEYNADGTPITEYVWLGDIPVAMIKLNGATTATYAVHTDHLNTPRVVLDAGGQVRWRWLGEPFGASAAEEQPTSGLAAVQLNLRFPGQQYEAFGGRYYNHFRDYDPTIGRYVQSDPIGLDGGINTYAYVNGNPVSFTDPLGLQSIVGCAANPAAAETCAEAGIINATPAPNAARLAVPIAKAISKECTSDGKDPCDELEQKVRDAKDHMGRTYSKGEAVCKPGMPRSELIRRANDWLRLAKARAQRDQRCFAGGDENHQIEQATAWKQVALCQGLFRNAN